MKNYYKKKGGSSDDKNLIKLVSKKYQDAREHIIREIATIFDEIKEIKIDPKAPLDQLIVALRKVLPLSKLPSNNEKTLAHVCKQIAQVLNRTFDPHMIDMDLSTSEMCRQVSDKLYALTVEINGEYYTVIKNTNMLVKNIGAVVDSLEQNFKVFKSNIKNPIVAEFHKNALNVLRSMASDLKLMIGDQESKNMLEELENNKQIKKYFKNFSGNQYGSAVSKIFDSSMQFTSLLGKLQDLSNKLKIPIERIKTIAKSTNPLSELAHESSSKLKSIKSDELDSYLKAYDALRKILVDDNIKQFLHKSKKEGGADSLHTFTKKSEKKYHAMVRLFYDNFNSLVNGATIAITELLRETERGEIKFNKITEIENFPTVTTISNYKKYYQLSGALNEAVDIIERSNFVTSIERLIEMLKILHKENQKSKAIKSIISNLEDMIELIKVFNLRFKTLPGAYKYGSGYLDEKLDQISSGAKKIGNTIKDKINTIIGSDEDLDMFSEIEEKTGSSKRKTGGVDSLDYISSSIKHSNFDKFTEIIKLLQLSVRKNQMINNFKSSFNINHEDYDKISAKNIAAFKDEITKAFNHGDITFSKDLGQIIIGTNIYDILGTTIDNKSSWLEAIEGQYKSFIEIIEIAEALDIYYANFIDNLLEKPIDIKNILLDISTDLILRNKDNSFHDKLLESHDVVNDIIKHHMSSEEIINRYNSIKTLIEESSGLKNLISVFAKIAEDKSSFNSTFKFPVNIYDGIIRYLNYRSLLLSSESTHSNKVVLVDENDNIPLKSDNITAKDPNVATDYDKLGVISKFTRNINNNIYYYGLLFNKQIGTILNNAVKPFNKLYVEKLDCLLVKIIESMFGKIFVAVDVYNIMNKITPQTLGYEVSPTRLVLGAGDVKMPKIKSDLLEIYVRIPLLVRLYSKIFPDMKKIHENSAGVGVADKTIFPEIRSENPLNRFYNVCMHDNVSEYDMRIIIEYCNEFYDECKSSNDPCLEIMKKISADVNERIGFLIRKNINTKEVDYKFTVSEDLLNVPGDEFKKIAPSETYSTKSFLSQKSEKIRTEFDCKLSTEIGKIHKILIDGVKSVYKNITTDESAFTQSNKMEKFIKYSFEHFNGLNDENKLTYLIDIINNRSGTDFDLAKNIGEQDIIQIPLKMLKWLICSSTDIVKGCGALVNCFNNNQYGILYKNNKSIFNNYSNEVRNVKSLFAESDLKDNLDNNLDDIVKIIKNNYPNFGDFIRNVMTSYPKLPNRDMLIARYKDNKEMIKDIYNSSYKIGSNEREIKSGGTAVGNDIDFSNLKDLKKTPLTTTTPNAFYETIYSALPATLIEKVVMLCSRIRFYLNIEDNTYKNDNYKILDSVIPDDVLDSIKDIFKQVNSTGITSLKITDDYCGQILLVGILIYIYNNDFVGLVIDKDNLELVEKIKSQFGTYFNKLPDGDGTLGGMQIFLFREIGNLLVNSNATAIVNKFVNDWGNLGGVEKIINSLDGNVEVIKSSAIGDPQIEDCLKKLNITYSGIVGVDISNVFYKFVGDSMKNLKLDLAHVMDNITGFELKSAGFIVDNKRLNIDIIIKLINFNKFFRKSWADKKLECVKVKDGIMLKNINLYNIFYTFLNKETKKTLLAKEIINNTIDGNYTMFVSKNSDELHTFSEEYKYLRIDVYKDIYNIKSIYANSTAIGPISNTALKLYNIGYKHITNIYGHIKNDNKVFMEDANAIIKITDGKLDKLGMSSSGDVVYEGTFFPKNMLRKYVDVISKLSVHKKNKGILEKNILPLTDINIGYLENNKFDNLLPYTFPKINSKLTAELLKGVIITNTSKITPNVYTLGGKNFNVTRQDVKYAESLFNNVFSPTVGQLETEYYTLINDRNIEYIEKLIRGTPTTKSVLDFVSEKEIKLIGKNLLLILQSLPTVELDSDILDEFYKIADFAIYILLADFTDKNREIIKIPELLNVKDGKFNSRYEIINNAWGNINKSNKLVDELSNPELPAQVDFGLKESVGQFIKLLSNAPEYSKYLDEFLKLINVEEGNTICDLYEIIFLAQIEGLSKITVSDRFNIDYSAAIEHIDVAIANIKIYNIKEVDSLIKALLGYKITFEKREYVNTLNKCIGTNLKQNTIKYFRDYKRIELEGQFSTLFTEFIKKTSDKKTEISSTSSPSRIYRMFYRKILDPILNGEFSINLEENKNKYLTPELFTVIRNSVVKYNDVKGTQKYVEDSYELIPDAFKNKLRRHIYSFHQKFKLMSRKLNYFKDIMYWSDYKDGIGDIQRMIAFCTTCIGIIESVIKEIGEVPVAGEIMKNYIKNFTSQHGKIPYMPITLSLPYITKHNPSATTDRELIYANRAYFAPFNTKSFPGFYEIVNNFNTNSIHKISERVADNICENYVMYSNNIYDFVYSNGDKYMSVLDAKELIFFREHVKTCSLDIDLSRYTAKNILEVIQENKKSKAIQNYSKIHDFTSVPVDESILLYHNILDKNFMPINLRALYRTTLFSNVFLLASVYETIKVEHKDLDIFKVDFTEEISNIFKKYLISTNKKLKGLELLSNNTKLSSIPTTITDKHNLFTKLN